MKYRHIPIRKSMLYDIILMLLFLLLDRTIKIYYFNSITAVKVMYARLSEASAVIVIFIWFQYVYKQHRSSYWKGIVFIFLFFIELLFTTILHQESIRAVGMSAYPVLTIFMLTTIACRTREKMMRFIHAIANLYCIITAINFILLPMSGQLFPEHQYFMGIENQIGYSLNLGLLFCILDAYFNGRRAKYIIYLVMYCVTLVTIFSGSNIVGMIIIITFLFVPPVTYLLKKIHFVTILAGYMAVFVGAVFLNEAFLSWMPVKYLITNILGKDGTLTNRTYLWAVAIAKIVKAPYLGYGVKDSGNQFYIDININIRGTLSAHNQILQTLYEGGIAAIFCILLFLFVIGKCLKKIQDEKVTLVFKAFILSTLVMLMAEAPGWNTLLYIGYLSIVISEVPFKGRFVYE